MITYDVILEEKHTPVPKTVVVEAENAMQALRKVRKSHRDAKILSCEIVRVGN